MEGVSRHARAASLCGPACSKARRWRPCAPSTDNGVPFGSGYALYGLTKLSVSWLRLGTAIERIKPGHPEQNGRHERMHLTLKKEATKPAAANVLQQQARFDAFIRRYNEDRPHQALGMNVPAAVYTRSPRVYRGLEDLTYPFHDCSVTVTHCGRLCFKGRKINLSHVFAGQTVAVTQVGDRVWLVTVMHYDLGYFDDETCRLEPPPNLSTPCEPIAAVGDTLTQCDPFGIPSTSHWTGAAIIGK